MPSSGSVQTCRRYAFYIRVLLEGVALDVVCLLGGSVCTTGVPAQDGGASAGAPERDRAHCGSARPAGPQVEPRSTGSLRSCALFP